MNIDKLKLQTNAKIEDALKIIGTERVRLAIVVNAKGKFLGVVSDSNIRRALIEGKNLKTPIKEIYTKNPLTITLKTSKEELLRLSSQTDIYDFPILDEKGDIIGIKSISSTLAQEKNLNFVVLMAGGLGTRLKELTKDTPKPMLRVGKKPILESIVSRLKMQKFDNFIFCVNYKRQIIEEHFKKGKEFGVKISYVKERKRLGTAGALSLIKQEFKESFVVMNADILTDLDFNVLLKAHKKSKAQISVCVREYEQQVPFGVIKEKEGFIQSIEEKPLQKFLVSAGIYVLEPEILKLVKYNEYLDMPELIKLVLEQGGKANTFLISDYWIDIGRLEEFKRANEEMK